MRNVIQAAMPCTHVYEARNIETGEEAVILTTSIKRPPGSRWSWMYAGFVTISPVLRPRFCRVDACPKWAQWKCDGMCVRHFRESQVVTPATPYGEDR